MVVYIWKVVAQEKDGPLEHEYLAVFVGAENSTIQNAIDKGTERFTARFANCPFVITKAEFIGIASVDGARLK